MVDFDELQLTIDRLEPSGAGGTTVAIGGKFPLCNSVPYANLIINKRMQNDQDWVGNIRCLEER